MKTFFGRVNKFINIKVKDPIVKVLKLEDDSRIRSPEEISRVIVKNYISSGC